MDSTLTIRAGAEAAALIRDRGFDKELFSSLIGASGGPKWLVLSQIDRVLCEHLLSNRRAPLNMLGSSVGSFRHACFAQREPLAAIERFEHAYIDQRYETKPTPAEVTVESRRILDVILGENGVGEILANQVLRTHFSTVRSRSAVATDNAILLTLGLGVAAIVNALSRPALGLFFERAVFSSGDSAFEFDDFSTQTIRLTEASFEDALLASGSIPLVMKGIRSIDGALPGIYRDGGVIDYHFDFTFGAPDGLILYPHFFDRITPGWLDKRLPWRRPSSSDLSRVVMIAPSPSFVAALPGGKVPDRNDFAQYSTKERLACWLEVVDRCRALADELDDLIAGGRMAERLEPFV